MAEEVSVAGVGVCMPVSTSAKPDLNSMPIIRPKRHVAGKAFSGPEQ